MFSKNKIFAASMDTVPNILDYVAEIMKSFAPRIVYETTLACEEIVVNIVSYAYPDGDGQLAIAWEEDAEHHKFKLRFEDSGIPFNPLHYKEPDVCPTLEERTIGGFGIFIIRSFTDDIQYAYVNGKNRLTITKEY